MAEVEEFLNTYHIPKLSPEDISNLNRTIIRNEIEAVIKNVHLKKGCSIRQIHAEF